MGMNNTFYTKVGVYGQSLSTVWQLFTAEGI